jgi:hypothetical protein
MQKSSRRSSRRPGGDDPSDRSLPRCHVEHVMRRVGTTCHVLRIHADLCQGVIRSRAALSYKEAIS